MYLVVSAASLLLLAWLYGGDVLDAVQARSAEVAAFTEPPSLPFAISVLLAGLIGAGVTVTGLVQKRSGAWRGYRVMPIVTVVVLFIDLFFVFGSRSPLTSADRSTQVIQVLTNQANLIGTPERVPTAQQLQSLLESFEAPAYLVRGVRPKGWVLKERQGCEGPVLDAGPEPVGTLFYCVRADSKQAWLSLVALPANQRFGTPRVLTRAGQVVAGVVVAPVPDDPEDDEGPPAQGEPRAEPEMVP